MHTGAVIALQTIHAGAVIALQTIHAGAVIALQTMHTGAVIALHTAAPILVQCLVAAMVQYAVVTAAGKIIQVHQLLPLLFLVLWHASVFFFFFLMRRFLSTLETICILCLVYSNFYSMKEYLKSI